MYGVHSDILSYNNINNSNLMIIIIITVDNILILLLYYIITIDNIIITWYKMKMKFDRSCSAIELAAARFRGLPEAKRRVPEGKCAVGVVC